MAGNSTNFKFQHHGFTLEFYGLNVKPESDFQKLLKLSSEFREKSQQLRAQDSLEEGLN